MLLDGSLKLCYVDGKAGRKIIDLMGQMTEFGRKRCGSNDVSMWDVKSSFAINLCPFRLSFSFTFPNDVKLEQGWSKYQTLIKLRWRTWH